MTIKITKRASDKKAGLTLAELKALIAEVDHAGLDEDAKVSASVGFKSQLQRIEIEG